VVIVLPHSKRQKEGEEIFDEGVKVFIFKNCWNKYFTRNLLPAKPAEWFSKLC